MLPVCAIVGRPNVGKSSLFNRIVGRRDAVVDDVAGVTRDRHYKPAAWQGNEFMLVDTGGMIPFESERLHESINQQIRIAIGEAGAVLFVVEAGCGITESDQHIARLLRRSAASKTLLVVNKSESNRVRYEIDAFRALGLGEPYPVSALHGSGVADLLDETVRLIKKHGHRRHEAAPEPISWLKIAVTGRPNVGKSSLVNKLLRSERMIVNDAAGTTRDAIDAEMTWNGRRILLIDTAGLRKKSHVKQDLEYFFNLRAIKSIERCDVAIVVVDAQEGIGVQDLRIVTRALAQHKGVVLAWNKWDLIEKKHDTFDHLVTDCKRRFGELRNVPVIAISARTGQRVMTILDKACSVYDRLSTRVATAEFENNLFSWVRAHPHPAIPKNPVRFLGGRQVTAPYPCFRFFTTNPDEVTTGYTRYLTNKLYDTYDFEGCPVTLQFKPVKKAARHRPPAPGKGKEEQ
ncbi:MAG: ribosome biogenesis GTPase Der [Chitinispirillaceae bacterium]|nr:ribosome biogenesis GTPase Der [Chitinispirillaceae bacterium]